MTMRLILIIIDVVVYYLTIYMEKNLRNRSLLLRLTTVLLIALLTLGSLTAFAAKKKYHSWQEVAIDMAICFDTAIEATEADDYKAAYDQMNDAYFGHYEVQGFEKNVMNAISRDRVDEIEAMFSDVKHKLLGNIESTKEGIASEIELLKLKVYKDAMVLDGVAFPGDADEVGKLVFGDSEPKYITLETAEAESESVEAESEVISEVATKAVAPVVDESKRAFNTFMTTFGLLLREGLEAILVLVAIIAYLVKTGNGDLKKNVYLGAFAGVVCSILLAFVIELILGGSGVAQELIEGWTMFIAVAVLFYVSHWMLHKSETQAWQKYINDKVSSSVSDIDKRSTNTLVFAAFLAVLREGAELILFYKASFASGMNDPKAIVYGLIAGTVVLAVIFVSYRFLTVKIPLRPFFFFTSILLFLMCISFMGKGVIELGEANVISGHTTIPALAGLNIGFLNITNRAETLIPQIMIAIASAWLVVKSMLSNRKKAHEV